MAYGSDGGIGFVVQQKKRRTTNEENNNNGGGDAGGDENIINNNNIAVLQQDSNATTATAATTFDIKYLLDGRLSQDVEKSHVSVAMLGTTTRRLPGSDSSNPSFSMTTTMTSSTNQPQLGAQSRTDGKCFGRMQWWRRFCARAWWVALQCAELLCNCLKREWRTDGR